MAEYWIDTNAGLDTNNGLSFVNAKRTIAGLVWGPSDIINLVRGGLYNITNLYQDTKSSSIMRAWGSVGQNPILRNPSGNGQMLMNCSGSGRSNAHWYDLDFDLTTDTATKINSAVYVASQNAGIQTDHGFHRCKFYGSAGNGMGTNIEGNSTGAVTNVLFEDCEFFDNGAHGLMLIGTGHRVIRCKAYNNGATNANGGHNFTSLYIRNSITSGWIFVAGTIYALTIPANQTTIDFIRILAGSTANIYFRLTKNNATPTTPSAGEYGVSGTTLYININADPAGHTFSVAWAKTENLLFEDCESYGAKFNSATMYQEGHGFVFDDFTSNSIMRRCVSHDNEGIGIGINQGSGNLIQNCLSYNNGTSGAYMAGNSNTISFCTAVNNNRGAPNGVKHNGDILISELSLNCALNNSVVVGDRPVAVYSGATSASNSSFTISKLSAYGQTARLSTNLSETNSIVGSPMLDGNHRPKEGSPLIGAGNHLGFGYRYRDVERMQRNKPPTIGAFDITTVKAISSADPAL